MATGRDTLENRTFFDCAGLYIMSILHESYNKSDIQKVYFKKWLLIPIYYHIDDLHSEGLLQGSVLLCFRPVKG